jgi:hypothetical protein
MERPGEHVIPLLMLLPFANRSVSVLADRLQALFNNLVRCDDRDLIEVIYTTLFDMQSLVRRQQPQEPRYHGTDWRARSLLDGLCSIPSAGDAGRKDTLTAVLRGKSYDFSVDRTVRVCEPGGLAGRTTEELRSHAWLPSSSRVDGGPVFLFVNVAGAGGATGLTPVAVEWEFSGDTVACFACIVGVP